VVHVEVHDCNALQTVLFQSMGCAAATLLKKQNPSARAFGVMPVAHVAEGVLDLTLITMWSLDHRTCGPQGGMMRVRVHRGIGIEVYNPRFGTLASIASHSQDVHPQQLFAVAAARPHPRCPRIRWRGR